MSALDTVIQVVSNMEYHELVEKARRATEALKPYLESRYDGDWFFPLLFLVSSVVNADGVFSRTEKNFLEDVLGEDEGMLSIFMPTYDAGFLRAAEEILRYMPRAYNADALFFVAAFAAVDGRTCSEEAQFIRILLA